MASPFVAPRLQPRRALTDDVYEAIKALLMDQEIPAGQRLSIDGLARDLGVSPTPVREALTRLESEGLVRKEALKGYRSAPLLTAEEFDDLYQFRLLVEPWAARSAASRIDAEGRRRVLHELASADAPSGTSYDDYKSLTAHDARFHALIAQLSGSRQVQQALERTHCHLHIFRLRFEGTTGADTVAEHRRIAEALLSGDADAAEEAMRAHLHAAMAVRLRDLYADGEGPDAST